MPPLEPELIEVRHASGVGAARRAARAAAQAAGFAAQACEEIALAATELATNLLKHARGGRLIITRLDEGGRTGLQVESRDTGPGIPDIEQALADGFSTAGSRGDGLGAVNRLMDQLNIQSHRGVGTHIVCRKWVRRHAASLRPCPLAFGAASRPHPKCNVNGDAFVIKQWSENALVGIFDGLGHGQFAYRAAQAARAYVETHFDQPLEEIFRGVGRACRATRGVVMALARFDWDQQNVVFASMGNIEARVFSPHGPLRVGVRRGIIGVHPPNPEITEHPWASDGILVLHSDGVTAHWSWEDFPALAAQPASAIAPALLRALAKDHDDATVLVARSVIP